MTTHPSRLPFSPDSAIFAAFQVLWRDEVGEELTYPMAVEYGPNVLALVAAVARAKREGTL